MPDNEKQTIPSIEILRKRVKLAMCSEHPTDFTIYVSKTVVHDIKNALLSLIQFNLNLKCLIQVNDDMI